MKYIVSHKSLIHTVLFVVLSGFYLLISAQTDSGSKYRQYLFSDFSDGMIKLKDGSNRTQKINYNTVTERMVSLLNGQFQDLKNIETIDTIILHDRIFVPVNQSFYEVLVNEPVALFIQHKSKLLEAGSPSGYGGTTQTTATNVYSNVNLTGRTYNMEVPSDYKIESSSVNWIRQDNKYSSFLSMRQLQKILSDHPRESKDFIDQNHIRLENREGLIKFVEYYNELIK